MGWFSGGFDEWQHFTHLQHFQASQSSEGSILDAADVVFVQLPAEHRGERDIVRQAR